MATSSSGHGPDARAGDLKPLSQVRDWFALARAEGVSEPEAAALATATPDGRPSVRMVLVRGADERDLRVYTNHESRKAGELRTNGAAALCLYWGPPLRRQVRVEGRAERLLDEEARLYFDTRARESRLGAWASPQSRPIADRDELDRLYAEADERFTEEEVPLPGWWGGYRIVPHAFELWQNRPNRLHDRARYERDGDRWSRTRLAP
jgi:pyridoxamine 5'-phosphate oxidase